MIEHLRYAPVSLWRWAMLFGVGAASLIAVMMGIAGASDLDGRYARSPYAEWFRTQTNDKGEWCCDKSDGHYYDGAYVCSTPMAQ